MTTPDRRALISTRKGLFTLERNARGWSIARAAFEGDNVTLAYVDPRDRALYVALNHGHFGIKLHRSRDGGESWNEIAAPKYPPKPEGQDDLDPMRGTPIAWNLELVWALAAGGADQPGTLWSGTVPGGLFRSDDAGETWQLVRSLWDHEGRKRWTGGGMDRPGIHSVVVDPRDSRRISVAVSTGGVWQSRDGGSSWQVGGPGMRAAYMPPELARDPIAQDVHRLVTCAASPDVLWAQHHNGIFRSTDGATSWTELDAQPSSFGFAVAAHPHDPQTAWFVPAIKDERRIPVARRLVVTRTRDGGRSFETLGRGLPDAWAYDLVYRHALDVDGEGRSLMMGSTTGNLYVSDDAGEAWTTVATHLPPIYAVSFTP